MNDKRRQNGHEENIDIRVKLEMLLRQSADVHAGLEELIEGLKRGDDVGE